MIDPTDLKTIDLVATQQAQQQMQQVVATYGDNLPYNYDRVLNECAFFIEASAKSAIELGKRLIMLKEMEGHGNFRAALETLGLSVGTAHNVMKVATKLSNVQTSEHLLSAVKSRSKVFEMMILDNDDLKELTEGGTVAGIKLDDVDKMSVRELRIALREAKELSGTKDKQLQAKNQKLDEMEGKLDNLSRKLTEKRGVEQATMPDPDREAEDLRKQATTVVNEVELVGIRAKLRSMLQALDVHREKTGIDHTPTMLGYLSQLEYAISDLRNEFSLYGEPIGEQGAFWETEAAQQAADTAMEGFDWATIEGVGNGQSTH
ncbi:DUF3102 domain-containing protein [Thiothrix lacustris]|uniref:DUF3102 domain-containing protein n=1 Tax=Thiothrix lacustris TaxID=525917 RepID=UPI0006866ED1|nr:DUF3102 domain-containing protein [Thiothrix lacustris]